MSTTISILPEQLANKIAAGEVVQRPANAVKEMLENSIDAGASRLTLLVEEGGTLLIHLTDDGSGMSPEDAEMAFRRHATSKIHSYEDLENIRTLGFRGEALAAIGAVAQVELKTRTEETEVGTLVRVEGGAVKSISQCATAVGSSIAVRNLFYNTPARRNFLKSVATEFRHISDVVQRIALSHPSIAVKFISGKETIYDLSAQSQDERVKDLFGEKLYSTLIPVAHEAEMFSLLGYVGKPDFARKSRIEQYLYLNGRSIINRTINHAVFKAYEHLLEKGSFPFFILFLTIDPKKVDVNVHPTKMEVKFEDEGSVYRWIHSALRKTLSVHDLIPSFGIRENSSVAAGAGLRLSQIPAVPDAGVFPWNDLLRRPHDLTSDSQPSAPPDQSTSEAHLIHEQPMPGNGFGKEFQFWQVHNKYILAMIEGGLMVIDQHAAHERVLYERTVTRFKERHTQSQQLLFPLTIEMTPGDAALVMQLKDPLGELGFGIKLFGKTTIIVEGVPVDVRPGEEGKILQNVIDLYKRDESSITLEPRERLAKSFSCRAAIKKGDPLNAPEMKSLLDQLFATEIPFVCPHGRPVMIKLSIAELDRRFGRTS